MTTEEQNELENDQSQLTASDSQEIGQIFVAGGVVWAVAQIIRGKRGLKDLLLPIGLVGFGVVLLSMQRREHIDEVAQNISAELNGLDPIAKAQVLKTVAEGELHK
jgi:hypothetical protein